MEDAIGAPISFRVFRVFRGYISGRGRTAGRHGNFGQSGPEILRSNEHYAEPGAAPNRHLRLGIRLGVFGFHMSDRGGR